MLVFCLKNRAFLTETLETECLLELLILPHPSGWGKKLLVARSDHPGTTLCSSYTVTRSMWSLGKASSDPRRCLWASITADWKWPAVEVGTPHMRLQTEGHLSKRQYPCPLHAKHMENPSVNQHLMDSISSLQCVQRLD